MKRLALIGLALVFTLLGACVTINVYFPAAAAEKAAEQFIGTVIGSEPASDKKGEGEKPADKKPPQAFLLDLIVPAAQAAESADLNVQTAALREIQARMKQRFDGTLQPHFASGAIGLAKDGLVAVRDAAAVPLAQRAALNQAVSDDNRDRNAVYREIAVANGHPEWEAQIRSTFAAKWVEQARAGWYYQDPAGAWKQK
jgi:uncharacterized protein YdbL (DUF1318 family)